jgi:hypothetical protein
MEHLLEYLGLAGTAFLSATVFPFQSEVVLAGMLLADHYHVWLLVLAASLGNILGALHHPVRGPALVPAHSEAGHQGGGLVPPLWALVPAAVVGTDHR